MNNKKSLLILALTLILLIGGASLLYRMLGSAQQPSRLAAQGNPAAGGPASNQKETRDETQEETQSELLPAPDFTVYDIDGNAVSLSDFCGKPVVLNFWASWCGPCQSEMPDFDAAHAQYGGDVCFLMVNMTDGSRETVESASDFIAESGYSFPVFYDTDFSAAEAYGVYSLPASYFIDADGNAIARAIGAIDEATLQQGIDLIFSE